MKDKNIKITHVSRYAYPHIGGIESFIEMFNYCVDSSDINIEVLCNSNDTKSSINEKDVFYNRARYLFDFAANSISLEFIWKLSKVKTDIIIYHMPCIFSVIAHFIAKPKYKKMIICYHSDIIGYDKIMKPFWWIYKRFLKLANIVHVQSPQMIENSMANQFRDKVVMIPYLIDSSAKFNEENVKRIKDSVKNKKIIFSLGRHVKYKGFKYLIEAMKKVDNAVLILGGSGPLTENFQLFVSENNLSEKVLLAGRIPDSELEDYYEACDIFVLPSILPSETFAVVQLEAMKHSKPIINAYLNTGVNYVSLDKETGITIEPGNVEQLATAINKLIKNDKLRLEYGNNARQRVENVFDIEKVKTKYAEILSHV